MWEGWNTDGFGSGSAGEVAEAALMVIDNSPGISLVGCGILCEEAMEQVLGRQSIGAGEAAMFSALERWISADVDMRKIAGERLVSCVSFECMPPSFLKGTVAKSGLVSKETLSALFEAQALKAEASHGFVARDRDNRTLPNWYSTGSAVFTGVRLSENPDPSCMELLDRSLRGGCWAWDIRVEQLCETFAVGFITGDVDLESIPGRWWLGYQPCGYAYEYNGSCSHNDGSIGQDGLLRRRRYGSSNCRP